MTTWVKDPNAILDYKWDYSSWLEPGDTITAHDIIVDGTLTLGPHSHDDTSVTAWLSGGTEGDRARVTVRVTTADGRVDDRTSVIEIRAR